MDVRGIRTRLVFNMKLAVAVDVNVTMVNLGDG